MMLTSGDPAPKVESPRELGIAQYLHKPVGRTELLRAICGGMEVSGPGQPLHLDTQRDEALPEDRHLRLLLVDDSWENRMLIQAYLQEEPYQIDVAENGQISVEMFTTGRYDLVLMDIQMPVMDGLSATRAIRDWEGQNGFGPTPILAVTAHALKEDELKSRNAGCDAHLTKPIKKADLLAAIRAHTNGLVGAAN
jgi:CheY-like chemotaxis protein